MIRGLDHVVHCVRDLEAAGATYQRLGFQVGVVNRHPWGTWNRVVQIPGFFIELLSVGESDKIVPPQPRHVSFGAYNRDWALRNGEGLSCLVLETDNARTAAQGFRASAVGDYEPFHFSRQGRRPDGSAVTVAFTLAFAADTGSPDVCFFVCEQHFPENFWNPAFQVHPNGATAVRGIVLVADNPSDHHGFLGSFSGRREMHATSLGIVITTARGEIAVMEPAVFANVFGFPPPASRGGMRLAAIRLGVADLAQARAALGRSGVAVGRDRLAVPPAHAHGAALIFEAE
ncbi:VOC family protein [Blastochloris viridis]|uniref:Lactoylglutathione lyase and related lyases n=1 Tax=Blastochloris viridis TaxID=1079 RepID=A0A0H5BIY9_BLAVI|nr:VOC family protein [Blastochloris viridis]ALK09711.1 hypothetical protein BVIR_1938 [Blastochloris viridis]BAS00397.1 lactoylglutathione lyase and related lyases [Blastochloris viridis]CUU42374.1 hypothetical protein BVIRIDIS_13830 [Blastochloris viridis]